MKISIIIPTLNHLEDCLKPCIESIIKYTDFKPINRPLEIDVIVVANGCTDATAAYIKALEAPFKLLWHKSPLGYPKAVNKGIEASNADYVILLNNDTVLLEQKKNDWIYMLLDPFVNENVGVTGPIKGPSEPAGRDFIIFFCAMIPMKVIKEVGPLNEKYTPGGGEDTEFCIEAENRGYKLVQVPSLAQLQESNGLMIGGFPIYHLGEATMNDNPEWQHIFDRNSDMLRIKYNRGNIQMRYGNNFERAVIGRSEVIPPREYSRYKWASENMVGNKVLEIGCSSGYGLRLLPRGIDYTGVDYDKDIIEFATSEFGNQGKFIHADINKFDLDFYDTIIAFEFIEHIDNGKEFAQKLKEHCKCLLITTPYKEPIVGYVE